MSYLLALDQGTTSSRAIIFDADGQVVASDQREFAQYFPQPGWVEHDAVEIWNSQRAVAHGALKKAGLEATAIAAIGITNQRETTVLWDRASGLPLAPAIVWQDRRTAMACDNLRQRGLEKLVSSKTGLLLDPYFSASKLAWLLDTIPNARPRAAAGEIAFGTIDSWLVWNLTGGAVHATDPSNAARTLLYDIHHGTWDHELLALFDIPPQVLPKIRDSSGVVGTTAVGIFSHPIPIAGIAGDQQAATFGNACLRPGLAKNTYGTGCFLLLNTGAQAVVSQNRLLTTVAWQLPTGRSYALEGSVFMGGAIVQWLRDGLGIINAAAEVEALAASVDDTDGVVLVPAFAGLGAPWWNADARATLSGMTRGTTRAHLARAALEAIAAQTADVLSAMQDDAHMVLSELRVDGGAARNNFLMQLQADVLGVPVVRPQVIETTALGAAYLAGLAVGVWQTPEDVAAHWQLDRRFEPTWTDSRRQAFNARWRHAVSNTLSWCKGV